ANGIAALAAAALIVMLSDPMALFSASFQMSYGVVLAIMAFGLPLGQELHARWRPNRSLPKASWTLRDRLQAFIATKFAAAAGMGLAAALVSSVTWIAFFNYFAPGGLVANLVLVPLASVVIAAGVSSIVAGLAGLTFLNILFNHAALVL